MIYQRLLKLAEANGITLLPSKYTFNVRPSEYFQTPSLLQTRRVSGQPDLPPRGSKQDMRAAYIYWYHDQMSLEDMCKKLAVDGDSLKPRTVISYVIGALRDDASLPFTFDKLVQMEIGSWDLHRDWVMKKWAEAEKESVEGGN